MGKGDRSSRRGKLFRGSYGKTRPHKRPKAPPKKK
ncbi:MAG TPA: 30S ribosomal protein THX [Gammaproteobacteria bacterium]|nr:30S ribosomal protein THX [Gammaproteobacteria bacterium]